MVLVWLLAGCAGSGDGSPMSAKRMTCDRMCDHDYDSCTDSFGARAGESRGGAFGVGIGATCDREVRSCQDHCRMLAIESNSDSDSKAGSETGETHPEQEQKAP